MKRTQGSTLALVLMLCTMALYLVPTGWAQTVELQLDNPASNNVMDNEYVGPYDAQNLTSGGSTQIICDDFYNQSSTNPTNYTVNSFSTLGNTLFGSALLGAGFSMSAVTTFYEEAAWLAVGMIGQNSMQQGYYSYAVWAIFDPFGVAQWLSQHDGSAACNAVFGAGSWGYHGCSAGTGGLVGSAEKASSTFTLAQFANVRIFTPQNCKNGCQGQEFFQIVAAEGGTTAAYLMLAGLACFGAVFFRSRLQPRPTSS
jgi:hypothetical protein